MTASARMVERECAHCGQTFEIDTYAVKRGKGTYCSRPCANRAIGLQRLAAYVPKAVDLTAQVAGLPTLRWPDERDKIPFKCPRPHCGGMVEVDPPYGLVKVGEARCLSCTRAVALLRAGAVREIEAARASKHVACSECGAGIETGIRGRPATRCAICQSARDRKAARAAARLRRRVAR